MINNIVIKAINNYCKGFGTKIICIDGITCSGKSFFSKLLFNYLHKRFKKTILISKDIFLLSRSKRIKLIPKLKKKINMNQNILHYNQKKLKKLIYALENKEKIIFEDMYDRNTGKNNKKIIFNFKNKHILIFEGLYVLNDFENHLKNSFKLLIIENIYISLIRKIQRIRDKKISIQNVIDEFTHLHLPSFLEYLYKYKFDICLNVKSNKFIKTYSNKKKQIEFIKLFRIKHLY
jgi:uridine kinase